MPYCLSCPPVVPQSGGATGSACTWTCWNHQYVTQTTGTTVLINPPAWEAWNSSIYSTAAGTTTIILVPTQWQSWNTLYAETAEQERARWQAQQEAQAERDRRYAALRAERLVASSRAEELLLSLLSEEQAASYRERGFFEVTGSRGGRWRIRSNGQAGNVDLMPEIGDVRDASFCCHPPDGLPAADAHLAQMLQLVSDEDGFRRTANVAYRRPLVRVS